MSKRSAIFPRASLRLSDLILLATSVHLIIGLAALTLWLARGSQILFQYYFAYQDPLFLLLCTGLEFSLTYLAWKQFSPGQYLRRAWLLIMIAAICHVVGMLLSHILCQNSYLNPLYVLDVSWYKAATGSMLPLGLVFGGPLHMMALAGGLFLALRLCRKFGLRAELRWTDWVILGIVVVYTLQVAFVLTRLRLGATPPPHLFEVVNWANDPLLSMLLFLAFFLRRSVVQMGQGYVTKCWGAYVVAIFGTALASLSMWATNFGILPYPESSIVWFFWPVIYAAYALGPAYQVEAAHVAQGLPGDRRLNPKLPPVLRDLLHRFVSTRRWRNG